MHKVERGYSLIEVAVAIGIFGIVGAVVGAILVSTTTFTRRGTTQVETQQMGRLALSHLAQELREAPDEAEGIVIWPANGGPFYAIGFVSAREEAAGRPFGTDSAGAPIWRTAVYYMLDRGRGELRRIAQPWDHRLAVPASEVGVVVARGVRDIGVTREGDIVRITMDVTVGQGTARLETSVYPRN